MPTGHGGKRRGAGRPRRGINARTREITDRAVEQGITPLEVMLDNMRFHHQGAAEVLNKLFEGDRPHAEADEGEDPERLAIIEGIKNVLGLRKEAQACAKDAAPYCHSRQGYAAEGDGQGEEIIPLVDRLKEYERRDKLKAAGDKVVELKPQDGQRPGPSSLEPIPPTIS